MQQLPLDENQLQMLDAIAGCMILRWLPDGSIISANINLCECLGESDEDLRGNLFFSYICEQDYARLLEYIAAFNLPATRNSIDYRVLTKNGEVQWQHWCDFYDYNSHLKRYEFLSIGHNISESNSPQSRINHIEYFDRLITTLSVNFINLIPEKLDEEINHALKLIGEYSDVDRSYVFLYSNNGLLMENTHEWCAAGIEPQINNLKNMPVDSLPWLNQKLNNFEVIQIQNIYFLPPEASAEKEIFEMESIQSLVAVPIIFSNVLIGFLGFDSVRSLKQWTEDDISVLQIFGAILGNAIVHIDHQKKLNTREHYLSKLNEISMILLNSTNLEDKLSQITDLVKDVIKAEVCFITMWNEEKKIPIPIAASAPYSQNYNSTQFPPNEKTITSHVLSTGEVLIIEDVLNSSLLSTQIANLFSARSIIGIPLIADDRKLGAIILAFNTYHQFTQTEIDLAQQTASLISLALLKQISLEVSEKYTQELETLRKTGMIVASTLEPEKAIDLILDQLDQVIPFDTASVQLFSNNNLEIRAGKGWTDPTAILGQQIPIPGDNPNTRIIEDRQPNYYADVQEIFPSYQKPPHHTIHSWLGAPLIVNDEVIGMIALDKTDINFYNNNHIKLARVFADQVAISLHNAQSYKNEEQRVKAMEALRDTLSDISNELELSQLLPEIVKRATTLMNANGGELGLFDPETKEVRVVVSQNIGKDLTGIVLAPSEGLFGKVAETLQPVIIQDYLQWDDRLQVYDGEKVQAVIATPLLYGKHLLGVIGIARTVAKEPFTENDQDILSLFAQQAAIAINNAKLYKEVENLTKIDELTGAYNRRGLNELSHRELARAHRTDQSMAMLMIDIDLFKDVNDHYGHAIGDQILRSLSKELQINLRETDILCRYGGEEFAILLPETNIQTATTIAERLRIIVANKPFEVPDMVLNITISIGISWMQGKAASIESMLILADKAMYMAKRSGRNKVCLYNDI
jgi:diguanylate cyclase (GGDEF)-like protein